MFVYDKKLQYPVKIAAVNPRLAAIIITQYGGPDGELGASLRYLSQQEELRQREEELMVSIKTAVNEILSGVEAEDEAYTQLLDKMVIEDSEHISVYLHLLPFRWAYAMKKLIPDANTPERNSFDASVPISVNNPFSSSKGMA